MDDAIGQVVFAHFSGLKIHRYSSIFSLFFYLILTSSSHGRCPAGPGYPLILHGP